MKIGMIGIGDTNDKISSYSAIFDNAATKTDEADQQRVIETLKNLSEGKDMEDTVGVDVANVRIVSNRIYVRVCEYSHSFISGPCYTEGIC